MAKGFCLDSQVSTPYESAPGEPAVLPTLYCLRRAKSTDSVPGPHFPARSSPQAIAILRNPSLKHFALMVCARLTGCGGGHRTLPLRPGNGRNRANALHPTGLAPYTGCSTSGVHLRPKRRLHMRQQVEVPILSKRTERPDTQTVSQPSIRRPSLSSSDTSSSAACPPPSTPPPAPPASPASPPASPRRSTPYTPAGSSD
jgi:hypothetical protein